MSIQTEEAQIFKNYLRGISGRFQQSVSRRYAESFASLDITERKTFWWSTGVSNIMEDALILINILRGISSGQNSVAFPMTSYADIDSEDSIPSLAR